MMAALPLAALGASLGVWAYGTYEPNSPLFGRVIGRGPGAGRVAYLTFDDGPNPGATEPILDTLAGLGVPASFFMVGEHVRRFPGIARRVVAAGHEVGNHTLRHPKLHFRGPRRIDAELTGAHAVIANATGRAPRSFRAPHGYRNPFVTRSARRLGYTVFGWTFGVWDSDPRVSAAEIRRRVARKLRPGAIILLHDGDGYDPAGDRRRTAEALPGIIADARVALGAMARRACRGRAGAQVSHGLPVARDGRRAARRESAAPRGRVRRESLVARRQGVGVASHPQARGAAPLAGGPGGEPGGCGRQRPVCGRRGRGGAGARDRTAGRRAGRRRALISGVDARSGGARPGAVSRDGAERARAGVVAARAAGRCGAHARDRAAVGVGARLGVARRPAARLVAVPARGAPHHGTGRTAAVAHRARPLQLGRSVGDLSSGAPRHARSGIARRLVHGAHRRESERPAAAHAGERRRDPGGARRGVAAVRGGARAGRRSRARAPGAAGPAGAAAGRD